MLSCRPVVYMVGRGDELQGGDFIGKGQNVGYGLWVDGLQQGCTIHRLQHKTGMGVARLTGS